VCPGLKKPNKQKRERSFIKERKNGYRRPLAFATILIVLML
jgi:hypothetical protein